MKKKARGHPRLLRAFFGLKPSAQYYLQRGTVTPFHTPPEVKEGERRLRALMKATEAAHDRARLPLREAWLNADDLSPPS